MRTLYLLSLFIAVFCHGNLLHAQNNAENVIEVVWNKPDVKGEVKVNEGVIRKISLLEGEGKITGNHFELNADKEIRIQIEINNARVSNGPEPTVVSVLTEIGPFSFFLRDVDEDYPIFIPDYRVAVLPGNDRRSYNEVEKEIISRELRTKIQQIEQEKEASFDVVAPTTRKMSAPIWLGLGRDMRMFDITEELEDMGQEAKVIRPKYASSHIWNADRRTNLAYIYSVGRGVGVRNNIKRSLEEGVMPIYHSRLTDDDVVYHTISFVSFARKPLNESTNTGTHYVVANRHSNGRTFSEEHKEELEERMKTAYDFDDDMVLYSRTFIENRGSVPRYAWIKTPRPGATWGEYKTVIGPGYDAETGFSLFAEDNVFCISLINGKPMANEEIAILLKPGEKLEYDFFMPHTAISESKARALASQSFPQRYTEAKQYWKNKLDASAEIKIPEKRIEEMLKAGLFHLNLIS